MNRTNLLILVGYNGDAFDTLSDALRLRLNIPVESAYLESSPSVGESIQAGVAAHNPRYVIVLPLFVGASESKNRNVQMIVEGANERGFDMIAHYGKPIVTHEGVIASYADLLAQKRPDSDTALLVVGRGSRDANSNAEAYQVARLLYESAAYASVDVAFYGTTTPKLAVGIQRCIQAGAHRIIVLPYTLYDAKLTDAMAARVSQQRELYPDVEIAVSAELGDQAGIIEAVSQHYEEALAELTANLSSEGRYISKPHSHGAGRAHTHTYRVEGFTSALLPPRYQGDVTISAAPMGAADLVYDADGCVAWDQIWGDFCDLALAGGPPHRGTLLEPVSPEAVRANPQRYQAVLAELERGIRMITGLPMVNSSALGWIGVRCDNEEMALWLLRAIVVENISVRREGDVLYFPAGPDFRLEGEIKNVITVIAKTHHYWTEHITSQSPSGS